MTGAKLEIVLAMAGSDVDEAGSLLGGDEVPRQQRHRKAVAVRMPGQWVAGDAAGERGAIELRRACGG